jgi:hypothetical protein
VPATEQLLKVEHHGFDAPASWLSRSLYEGTSAIPEQDCFFPKIVRGNGLSLAHPAGQIEQFVNGEDGNGPLKVSGSRWPRRCWTSRAPVFCDLIPTASEQVKIEGAEHFLQERSRGATGTGGAQAPELSVSRSLIHTRLCPDVR